MDVHREFHRDVRNIIIRKMDIDTRRALHIYTKLVVPQRIVELLADTIAKFEQFFGASYVCLGPTRDKQSLYEICRFFNQTDMIDARIHHYPTESQLIYIVDLMDDA